MRLPPIRVDRNGTLWNGVFYTFMLYIVRHPYPRPNKPAIPDCINAFLSENPRAGAVVFEVHNDDPIRGRIPVPNAKITISKLLHLKQRKGHRRAVLRSDRDGRTAESFPVGPETWNAVVRAYTSLVRNEQQTGGQ